MAGPGILVVAINYLLASPGLVVPILGARTLGQLTENLGSVGWELTGEEMRALDEASAVPVPYPYRFIRKYTRQREGGLVRGGRLTARR